ncbi:hypothetical protein Pst134EB_003814 [Puccinia striiformis f. sp. tritici]|nr:hypothetical protein Pst134EB_003814 [Puccinia striiformis f. sp. tritici]
MSLSPVESPPSESVTVKDLASANDLEEHSVFEQCDTDVSLISPDTQKMKRASNQETDDIKLIRDEILISDLSEESIAIPDKQLSSTTINSQQSSTK